MQDLTPKIPGHARPRPGAHPLLQSWHGFDLTGAFAMVRCRTPSFIVVLGYGFRDKAINARLTGWLSGRPNRCLVAGHGDVGALVAGARFAIAGKWNAWIRAGRLRVVEKWVSDTRWSDIEQLLE
jgi:hypothetical protein